MLLCNCVVVVLLCVVVALLCVVVVVLLCVVVVVLYCVLPLVGILSEISKRLSAPVSNQFRGWVGGGEHACAYKGKDSSTEAFDESL